MNLREALIAGSEHGTDRLSVEADRRLRRRLGLESVTSTRRVWVWPALGAFAAAAILVIVLWNNRSTNEPAKTAVVATDGSAEAVEPWANVHIYSAQGTQVTKHDDRLVLADGSIEIVRKDQKPMIVDVPQGRVVIASYRSRITADRESFTILLDDGTGHYTDVAGNTYPIVSNVEFVWPRPAVAPPAPAPMKSKRGRANLAPGETPPVGESTAPPSLTPPIRRPDTPCTYKSDCDPGATCRKNEHGESVCMGNGGEAAACWFDNDCLSNLCVSRRCAP